MSLLVRFALIVGVSGVWFGIAVLGWGSIGAFFSHDALIALAVVVFAVCLVSLAAGGNLTAGVREDRSNRWVLVAFTVIGLLDAYLPAWSDRHAFLTIDGSTIRWCGVILFAAGCALRIWPVFVLGDRFSGLVAIQKDHTLVTTGIYLHIRKPSYLGMLVTLLGWGLAFRSGIGVLLAALIIPPLVARMNAEETLLREHFGAEYESYRARTARLVPWLY